MDSPTRGCEQHELDQYKATMACWQRADARKSLLVENEQRKSTVQDAYMFVAVDFAEDASARRTR